MSTEIFEQEQKTASKTKINTAICDMRVVINFEMQNFLERKGIKKEIAQTIITNLFKVEPTKFTAFNKLSEKDKTRFQIMHTLKKAITAIEAEVADENIINIEDIAKFEKKYQDKLKTAIQTALLNPKLTKEYNCFTKLAITLLNIVSTISFFPAVAKKIITGTFTYSTEGKSKEAVDRMQNILIQLSNDSLKEKKKKLGNK